MVNTLIFNILSSYCDKIIRPKQNTELHLRQNYKYYIGKYNDM